MSDLLDSLRILDPEGNSELWDLRANYQNQAAEGLANYFSEKGFNVEAIETLEQMDILGQLIDELLLGNDSNGIDEESTERARQEYIGFRVARALHDLRVGADKSDHGALHEIREQRAIVTLMTSGAIVSRKYDRQRSFRKNGTSRRLFLPTTMYYRMGMDKKYLHDSLVERLSSTPIAVVGGGASGVISAAYLSNLGFGNITVFDKHKEPNGIWTQDNVRGGSKNNPFPIEFGDVRTSAATNLTRSGFARSGEDIDRYLKQVQSSLWDGVNFKQAKVKSINPGDLNHEVIYETDGETKTENFPIVIYAPGLGSPKNPNDTSRMTTDRTTGFGERWQRRFKEDELRKLGGKVVVVGLGNSAAEMIMQMQNSGFDDYAVLTHRPTSDLYSDDSIYRDLSIPELTGLAGDISHIYAAVTAALANGKIFGGVDHWNHDGRAISFTDGAGFNHSAEFAKLFTLIGYDHKQADLAKFGMTKSSDSLASTHLDGEVVCTSSTSADLRAQVYPGYFAIGPVRKTAAMPNAEVIPGIQFQVQLLAFSLLVRAAEASLTSPGAKAT